MRSTKSGTTVVGAFLTGSLVALAMTGLASCGSSGDGADETRGGTDALTQAIPDDFPAPPGGVELDQLVTSDEEIHVQWESDRSVDTLVEFYDAELPGSGWESLSRREGDAAGLSATQYDTIARAFRTDYYDVPRGTTLSELASTFGVSHQAVSERLRRGHSHLVERLLSESTVEVRTRP
jgi:hypothetical protein